MEDTNDSMMIKPQLTHAAGLDIHKKKIVVATTLSVKPNR